LRRQYYLESVGF